MNPPPNPDAPTRRSFVKTIAVLVPISSVGIAGALAGCDEQGTSPNPAPHSAGASAPAPVFFSPDEAAFISAAVARLIPADDVLGPGAVQAGVPAFIDAQLGGAFGRGQRWYLREPAIAGSQQQGWQFSDTPAQLYRAAITDIDAACRKLYSKAFAQLGTGEQDALLHQMEDGSLKLAHASAKTFFTLLWQNTQEGFLADPLYGGNRGFAGWKLIGFPGPRYNYLDEITLFEQPYKQPFVSLASGRSGAGGEV